MGRIVITPDVCWEGGGFGKAGPTPQAHPDNVSSLVIAAVTHTGPRASQAGTAIASSRGRGSGSTEVRRSRVAQLATTPSPSEPSPKFTTPQYALKCATVITTVPSPTFLNRGSHNNKYHLGWEHPGSSVLKMPSALIPNVLANSWISPGAGMCPVRHPNGQIPAPKEKWTEPNSTNSREAALQFEQAQRIWRHACDMSTALLYPRDPHPQWPCTPAQTHSRVCRQARLRRQPH